MAGALAAFTFIYIMTGGGPNFARGALDVRLRQGLPGVPLRLCVGALAMALIALTISATFIWLRERGTDGRACETARPAAPSTQRHSATRPRISAGQVVLYLALTVALLIAIVPFIWVIFGSLKSSGEIFSSPFGFPRTWRWSNYETAWVEGHFGTYFFNSLAIAVPTVFLILACGSLAGSRSPASSSGATRSSSTCSWPASPSPPTRS